MKKQKQTFPKTVIKIEDMSTYELCRWAALKDAVDLIAEKCEERKLDFETFELKPLDILKFVDSLTDDLYNKVTDNESI